MDTQRVIPLHQNESYWLLDEDTAASYMAKDAGAYACYPQYDSLRKALASYAQIPAENILPTAGSDAGIRALADMYRRQGKKVLLPVPTFYGYERIFTQVDLPYTTVCYREENGTFIFPQEETLSALANGIDVIFLCTPNNPLGVEVPESVLQLVLDTAAQQGTTVVIDEAYYEFCGRTSLGRLNTQNLVILRTLSKAFGLAGARVGYLVASTETVLHLENYQLPWSIANPSVHAALAALSKAGELISRLQLIHQERALFSSSLSHIPHVQVFDSCTNFVLAHFPDAKETQTRLDSKGIKVALGERMSMVKSAQDLLKNTLRFAVPSPSDRGRVIEELEKASGHSVSIMS